jgi:hypothetical protein
MRRRAILTVLAYKAHMRTLCMSCLGLIQLCLSGSLDHRCGGNSMVYLKLGGPCSLQPASIMSCCSHIDYRFMLDVAEHLNSMGGLIVG